MIRRLLLLSACLAACSNGGDEGSNGAADAAPSVAGVSWSAETLVMESFPVQLRVNVMATNPRGDPVDLVFPDGCIVTLRAYADSSLAGAAAWDPSRDRVCTMALEQRTVPGGGALVLSAGTDAAAILGDSLPDGRYWIAAVLRPGGDTVQVRAGAADLAVARD